MKLENLTLVMVALFILSACAAASVKETKSEVSAKWRQNKSPQTIPRSVIATQDEIGRLAKIRVVIGHAVDYEAASIIPLRDLNRQNIQPAKDALEERRKKAVAACGDRMRRGEDLPKKQFEWCSNEAKQMSDENAALSEKATELAGRVRVVYGDWIEKAEVVNDLLNDELKLYRDGEISIEHEKALSDEVSRMFASFHPPRGNSLEEEVSIYAEGLKVVGTFINKYDRGWVEIQSANTIWFTIKVWEEVMMSPQEYITYSLRRILNKK